MKAPKFFGCLIGASFVFSWFALSSIDPMEETSLSQENWQGSVDNRIVPDVAAKPSVSPQPLPSPVGVVTTSELPQQPVYEAPVLDQKWEQSWSGPTTESYPSDTTMQQQESPVVSPVLVPNLGALQERITQILERDVMPFMPKRMPLFTLPGVN